MDNSNTRTEYRIIGRFRKDEKPHVVDYNWRWSLDDAEARLTELINKSNIEMINKKRQVEYVGVIGISTEYYSDYDLLDLKIQSREVTLWSDFN